MALPITRPPHLCPATRPRRGRSQTVTVTLTPGERTCLTAWQRPGARPARVARRGRALLFLADGLSLAISAQRCGVSRWTVYKWVRWFRRGGLTALTTSPARPPGRRPDHAWAHHIIRRSPYSHAQLQVIAREMREEA